MASIGHLPIGAKIVVPHNEYGNIIFEVADQNYGGNANVTTLITEHIILLRCFDAREPNHPSHIVRTYGNHRYSISNIDQWLDSTKPANEWYQPRHQYDQAPDRNSVWAGYNAYEQDAGFLRGFDTSFLNAMQVTRIKFDVRPVDDDGTACEWINRRMFLPSEIEVCGDCNALDERQLALFAEQIGRAKLKGVVSRSASQYSNWSCGEGRHRPWWLRSPSTRFGCARCIEEDGYVGDNPSHGGDVGIRPMCNVDSSLFVSDAPNLDGYHVLDHNIEVLPYDSIWESISSGGLPNEHECGA